MKAAVQVASDGSADPINNCTEVISKWLKHVARGIWRYG